MRKILLSFLALLILFEEWLWDILTLIGLWLSRALHLARFDAWLSGASPNTALVALGLPLVIVTPLNLFALSLLARGLITQGLALEAVAKLLGTLLVARVFRLTRPALMTFGWFATLYSTITRGLQWAHERVRATVVYRWGTELRRIAQSRARSMLALIRRGLGLM